MSSAGNSTVARAETDKMFFCYQCNQTITISISSTADPFCPLCNLGFLEEYTDPNPNLIPNLIFPISDPATSPFPFIPVMDFTNLDHDHDPFDPVSFIHSHLQQLQSSGINVQMLFDNGHHHGDYFFGRGLEDLIQQLAEEDDPNRYGPPPASRSAVDALPTVKVTKEMLRSEMNQCAVCMDEFEDGVGVKEMPCRHVYHLDCLILWLQLHNSCPVCRHELPTNDAEYESRVRGGGQTSVGGSGERRFSVSFPWSFRREDAGSDSGSGSDMDIRQDELD